MEIINIIYWHYDRRTMMNQQVEAYSLTEAIQICRAEHEYRILILVAEYADIQGILDKIDKQTITSI